MQIKPMTLILIYIKVIILSEERKNIRKISIISVLFLYYIYNTKHYFTLLSTLFSIDFDFHSPLLLQRDARLSPPTLISLPLPSASRAHNSYVQLSPLPPPCKKIRESEVRVMRLFAGKGRGGRDKVEAT